MAYNTISSRDETPWGWGEGARVLQCGIISFNRALRTPLPKITLIINFSIMDICCRHCNHIHSRWRSLACGARGLWSTQLASFSTVADLLFSISGFSWGRRHFAWRNERRRITRHNYGAATFCDVRFIMAIRHDVISATWPHCLLSILSLSSLDSSQRKLNTAGTKYNFRCMLK